MRRRKISDEQIIACYRELKAGLRVAKELHVAEQTVYDVLRRHGIERTGHLEYRERSRCFLEQETKAVLAAYNAGASTAQIAKQYKCSPITVLETIKRNGGIIRSAKPRMTAKEHDQARVLYEEGKTFTEIANVLGRSQHTIIQSIHMHAPEIVRSGSVGPGSPHWEGGRSVSHGYTYIWIAKDDPMACMAVKNGRGSASYVLEHRLAMARELGRPLLPTETVHHINGDPTDNRPTNLQLRQGKHGKHLVMCCMDCGSRRIGPMEIA